MSNRVEQTEIITTTKKDNQNGLELQQRQTQAKKTLNKHTTPKQRQSYEK